jgi:hypothetical protein
MCQPLCVGLLKVCLIVVVSTTAVSATAIAPDPLGTADRSNDLRSTLPGVRMALAAIRGNPYGKLDSKSPPGLLTVDEANRLFRLDEWAFTQPTATRPDSQNGDFLVGTPALPNRPTRIAYLAEQPDLPDELPVTPEAADDTMILQQNIEQPDMDLLEGR